MVGWYGMVRWSNGVRHKMTIARNACTHRHGHAHKNSMCILETLSESWYRSEISYNPPNLFLCCAPINGR